MPTIIVVDDNREYREVTQEVLELEGYTVMAAENGAVALTLTRQHKPDLIISNGNMPVMSGMELLQAVRADEQLRMIPFVMMTGRSSEEFLNTLHKSGADAVMLKPVLVEELLKVIGNLLKAET